MSEKASLEASRTANFIADSSETVGPTIHVVGVGLSGAASLSPSILALVEAASLVIGAKRHLKAFEYLWMSSAETGSHAVEAWPLGNFSQVFADLRSRLTAQPQTRTVILASGDPLFFGLGRLLLSAFAAKQLVFHPQVSSIQLAFSRLKLPWQDATLVSVHGRGEALLIKALKRGDAKIAVLTDSVMTPGAIASLLQSLDLPIAYQLWVCENLGDERERLSLLELGQRNQPTFSPLNVVVLVRQVEEAAEVSVSETSLCHQPWQNAPALPLIGLPDAVFKGFPDRPTLMTKREVRLLILGALAPLPGQTIWDIGAGTGSVSVELSRLCPTASLYAIEKTAMGAALIRHNARRLAISPIQVIQSKAMDAIANLPRPDRIFIGGSSGELEKILDFLHTQLDQRPIGPHQLQTSETEPQVDKNLPPQYTSAQELSEPFQTLKKSESLKPSNSNLCLPSCRIVLALATIEHLAQVTAWVRQPSTTARWHYQLTQINVSRSLPVGPLTRFLPLNPVTLVTLDWQG
ncbi:MAG: precorrin-6y C5,15-methyltransferase (decarboxylating) subunit CbiE [Cyanobacteria bacterium P01_F01_bin.53]